MISVIGTPKILKEARPPNAEEEKLSEYEQQSWSH